jgi:hypothetical protein
MSPYPNESLEHAQLSLSDFVRLGREILESGDVVAFVRFMLAGRWENKGDFAEYPIPGLYRVFINARQDAHIPSVSDIEILRDIDSVIGMCTTLPFMETMAVYPIASFNDTLKKTNHLTAPVPSARGSVWIIPFFLVFCTCLISLFIYHTTGHMDERSNAQSPQLWLRQGQTQAYYSVLSSSLVQCRFQPQDSPGDISDHLRQVPPTGCVGRHPWPAESLASFVQCGNDTNAGLSF